MNSGAPGMADPVPPAEPVRDVHALQAHAAGEQPFVYVETSAPEAAQAACVRWPGLGRLRAARLRAAPR